MIGIKLLVLAVLAAAVLYLILRNSKNSLYLLVASFPMFNVETVDFGGGFLVLSPHKVFGAMVVILMVVDVISKKKEFRFFSPHMVLSVLLLALLLISFMVNGIQSLSWAQRYLSNLVFLLAMVTWIDTRAEADRCREVFIASLVFFTILGLLGQGGQTDLDGGTRDARFEASMLNANRAAHAYLIGVGFSLAWFLRNLEIPWRRWVGFAVLMLLAYATMLTGSRAGLVALLIILGGLPLLLWRRPRGRSILVPVLLGAVTLAVFMPQVMARRAREIPTEGGDLNKEEAQRTRVHQYRLAFQLIDESPVIGIGPNEFNRVYSQRVEGDLGRALHSWYLNVAVDAGIPALLLFVLLFLVTFWVFVRGGLHGADPGLRGEGWSTALLVLGLMVFGTVSSVPYSKLTWLVFTFGAVDLHLQKREREERGQEAVRAFSDQTEGLSLAGNTVVVVKKG
ncbi:MAG: O-antigen ligase family protein [Pseudomonadota bacterium]